MKYFTSTDNKHTKDTQPRCMAWLAASERRPTINGEMNRTVKDFLTSIQILNVSSFHAYRYQGRKSVYYDKQISILKQTIFNYIIWIISECKAKFN